MNTWAPLWSGIVDSSLWDEPDYVVKVFVTMMARKSSDHIYEGTAYNLAMQSRKTEIEVLDALKILASPDERRVEKQEFDGRRIRAVEGGWLILNGEKYREKVSVEMRKARLRRAQNTYRRKHGKSMPLAGETAAVKAMENGKQEEADAIAAGER